MGTRHIFSFLLRHFCKPNDPVEQKRQQCILAGCLIMTTICFYVLLLHNIVTGTFLDVSYARHITLVVLTLATVHAKFTKTGQGKRLVFAMLLAFNLLTLFRFEGFIRCPQAACAGLIAPLLSLFLCRHRAESAFWIGAFYVGNAVMHLLQVQKMLPPSTRTGA